MTSIIMNKNLPATPAPAAWDVRGRILIVDDEPGVRDLLTELLESANYVVAAAADGETGLSLLDHDHFDLLLTDLVLPGLPGMEVVRQARRKYPDLAVIIITGKGTLTTAIQAIQQEAQDYVRKPFCPHELIERIKKAIETRRLRQQNAQLLAHLQAEREQLQARVEAATASLRAHLAELEQLNREQSSLFRLVNALRGKTVLSEVVAAMLDHMRDVLPIGEVCYVFFDPLGQRLAHGLPDAAGACQQVGMALGEQLERLQRLFRHEPDTVHSARVVDLLRSAGVAASALDGVLVEPLTIGRLVFGVICLFPRENTEGFLPRHRQLLALALAQVASVCEENLLLERGTQLLTMGELIAEIVHDLRSPLTALRNNAKYLAKHYQEDGEAVRSLEDLLASANQMERLVTELLNFSKPEEMQLGHVVVAEVLEKALCMTRDYLRRKEIEVVIPPDGLDLTATGNEHHLVEALVNIIVNAAQAMDKGGRLTFSAEAGTSLEHRVEGPQPSPSQRFVRIGVADTGCGIPAKDLGKVFHRFYTTREGGSGLGLSSVQRIVRQNLGYVAIDSEVGVGTTVWIYLLQ